MNDKGEKTCPLCTEEMDLTDQQLKPCKCGYEICVWCWHHIMDMAEKDGTEGRCPACRTPYNKERVVEMAANCERLVAELNVERKQKVQKAKPKASEGRKHLSSIRVIQRNLVCIMGLPLSLADEELLKRREYFGQYGKVLKVSISRTSNGVIQHSSNNSFSVYITYSKPEEAVRCIQSVHDYILEGRSLRACFGTTKYCHSWLKNVPCNNPHCLYLHDLGSQEDSFTKDEIVSAFTRSRVQQISSSTNNMQRGSGNVLPPPADEYSNVIMSSATKPVVKKSTGCEVRGSIIDDNKGESSASTAASRVTHVSTSWPSVANLSGLNGPAKLKPDTSNGPLVFLSEEVSTRKSECDAGNRSMMAEESWEVHCDGNLNPSESNMQYTDENCRTAVSIPDATPTIMSSSNHSPCLPASKDGDGNNAAPSNITSSVEFTEQSCSSGPDKDGNLDEGGELQSFCSKLSLIHVRSGPEEEHSTSVLPNSCSSMKSPGNQCSQLDNRRQQSEPITSPALMEATATVNAASDPKEDDSLAFDEQGLKGYESICHPPSSFSPTLQQILNKSSCHSWQPDDVCNRSNINAGPRNATVKPDYAAVPFTSGNSVLSNGRNGNKSNSFTRVDGVIECSDLFSDVGKGTYLGRFDNDVASADNHSASDMGESHIISNILSMDLDAWDEPLTSSHSLAKLMSETDRQHGSHKIPSSGKVQNSNQSRFSFARQDDLPNQIPDLEHFQSKIRHVPSKYAFPQEFMKDKDPSMDKCQNFLSSSSYAESDNISSSRPLSSSNMMAVSRARFSTPPGFAVSSRAPPPGFSHYRVDLAADSSSANHLLQTTSLSAGQIQLPSTGNAGSPVDVELIDPAILEVGKGIPMTGMNSTGLDMWQASSPQLSPFEHEARFQLLMQQPISAHQNLRLINHLGNRFSSQNDAYSIPPMLLDQLQGNNPSRLMQLPGQRLRNTQSDGLWGGWNEVKSVNSLGVSELLTNERLGFNKFIPGYEDLKCRMPDYGSLYNREFGI
uniref:CCR4-NOT transcription complex subunit 4 n=1 Tax=Davidia involucrata TaxID=16924 RepID=A0A5B7AMI5_DAVIN